MSETAPRDEAPGAKPGRKERLRAELRTYALVASYLWVCFSAVVFYKVAVLRGEGVHILPFGFAVGKALILGKFLLIGEAIAIGERYRARTVMRDIPIKVAVLFLFLVALTLVEELLVGYFKGHGFGETLAELRRREPLELLAECLLLILILVPLVTVKELSRILGPGVLGRMLRDPSPPRRE
jgi:hypothetical protein